MRVAIGSDRAANALMGTGEMTYNFGSTSRAYVVVLDGHFACRPPRCAGSEFFRSTATAAPTATNITPISTLVLTVHPKSLELTGLRAVRHRVDLASLGKTYSLSA